VNDVQLKAPEASQEQVSTWINLQQTFRVIQAHIDERLRAETDLSWPEFELLMRLELAADHPLQMNEIAAQLVGSPSGTTRIADRLETDGLIVRETPRENRRIVRVQLTDHGRKVLGEAQQTFRTTLHETFGSHLADSEVVELRRALRHLLEKNGAWQEARCNPTVDKPRRLPAGKSGPGRLAG
jgi:DNA-binding MarR family transcriptional regulator